MFSLCNIDIYREKCLFLRTFVESISDYEISPIMKIYLKTLIGEDEDEQVFTRTINTETY